MGADLRPALSPPIDSRWRAAQTRAMRTLGLSGGLASLALAAGCQPVEEGRHGTSQQAFDAIAEDETIRLVGTEPFWGGTVTRGSFVYTYPENQAGETIAVERFAGNSGLGFSGTRGGKPLDLTITRGTCSDGMSDRTYPYTATLRLAEEQRNGCAWTDRRPFTGPANP